MQTYLELNAKQSSALQHMSRETGESPSHILLKIFDEYLEQQVYAAWLAEKVAVGQADLDAGRSVSHETNSQQLRQWLVQQAQA